MSKIKICGYANVFNVKDYVNDIILPLSFSENQKKLNLLYEHKLNDIIGYVENIFENEVGLYMEGIINTNKKELVNSIFSNEIKGLSIGYIAKDFYYENNKRIISKIDLLEISLVKQPANKHCQILYAYLLE